ncbi:MAG: prolipoprotein diacylglyceryl transferase [bacterium]|nr:prolipoprotein diacylglyceryl transferase [bacterium]
MSNIALSIGPITIYWYSIMIIIGTVIGLIILFCEVKKNKMNINFFYDLIFYVMLFGIIGARIYYVLFNLDYYMTYPSEIIKIWHGGLAIHGGILSGFLVIYLYCKKHNVNMFKVTDLFAVSVIIAQSIGRWGNFFNKEAYGMVTSLSKLKSCHIPTFVINGMYIDGNYYQPTFLYESIWNLIGFIIMLIIRRKNNKIGTLTGFYLIWYSIGRCFIEYFRSDSLMFLNIKVAQIVSIILFFVGIFIILKSKGSEYCVKKKN